MKVVIALAVLALACMASSQIAPLPRVVQVLQDDTVKVELPAVFQPKEKDCVCKSYQYCREIGGTINSNYPCPGSYIFGCCIIPNPEQ